MSSVYGPELLKAADFEDNVEWNGGKQKKLGEEFETDIDRAKRIRKERKAQKEKDKETDKKKQMSQAIGAVLGHQVTTGKFNSFAPAGPPGPSVGPAGPPGPSVGPT